VLFEQVNKILATNFLAVPKLPEIDTYISQNRPTVSMLGLPDP
jgi:hypothetical protein